MPDKTWSYQQVTKVAEQKISMLIRLAAKETESFSINQYRHQAYGVYLLWSDLTVGWQEAGDDERIERLTTSFDQS